ncbi:MAG: uracil-DNA glycosylase [gamma proteobacterium symbiont of Bathyaustriella thionipta]|nr:uracil-DNA glycosylase [gamma proteobacterium symbiont of Bathyaustriella thionipta]MCU7950082.1 uracil-DNA glycosylase [gamma proteobacterium symbiont of Bathyaustriella thionipta]MCU7953932.1 uracil-DNA glycosylase [gamma proteobacterium symbiont of Bathyaustriella thionipta]MCU7956667.1 uracil-DNA glycosylase [gamma proteobacterium symbiont of Bathyaustriella thionipta]MCU7967875.1 uracil-DNA glycosylase [gamma proteobacterium symbiont of Bathyaustriella thionipta]
MATIQLDETWKNTLQTTLESEKMSSLRDFLRHEKDQGKVILPHSSLWFNALNSTPLNQVKVVILGQDPYPTPGHAHGLCFSVLPDVKPIPKSLINIYKELQDDLGIENHNGHLQSWAEQGVLLLNSVLTVASGQANSHQGRGWEEFTDAIINELNQQTRPIAFILWGAYAQKKGAIINTERHFVLRSPHPSPLSAYRGFFGSKPFSKINHFLKQQNQPEINWRT